MHSATTPRTSDTYRFLSCNILTPETDLGALYCRLALCHHASQTGPWAVCAKILSLVAERETEGEHEQQSVFGDTSSPPQSLVSPEILGFSERSIREEDPAQEDTALDAPSSDSHAGDVHLILVIASCLSKVSTFHCMAFKSLIEMDTCM